MSFFRFPEGERTGGLGITIQIRVAHFERSPHVQLGGYLVVGPFADADGMAASTAYSLANFYLLKGEREEARTWLKRSINVDSWSYFARIQAEADWVALFPGADHTLSEQ